MEKQTKNIFITSGITALGIITGGIVSHSITRFLVHLAIDRDIPKMIMSSENTKRRISGCTDVDKIIPKINEAKKQLEQRQCKTFEIKSYDGESLVAHWYPCENAKRIIIAMHGWRSSWSHDFGAIADFWHTNGCSVLFTEQRGQGGSGGKYISFGVIERYDCREWSKWISNNIEGNLPIYLAGISMGASTVLMASSLDMPQNVHGIIADCGFTSPDSIWKHVIKNNLRLSYGLRRRIANSIYKKKIKVGADEYSTTQALSNCTIPVLFIHGSDDRFVPIDMTYENYKACKSRKKILIVPGAGHGMSYFIDSKNYERISLEFFEECEA